jgi:hypothetical protein
VRNDQRRGAEPRIHAEQCFDYTNAGFRIQRTGRFVAQQHVGPLGDRACDRDPLLLAAGKLRREVFHTGFESDERECLFGQHRLLGDLRHKSDVS